MSYIICALLIITDQVIKFFSVSKLKPLGSVEIIKGILSFTYVENKGAAFGILQNARWIFILATIVIIAALIIYKIKFKVNSKIYNYSSILLISGGIANLIDRIFLGYVVDMIEVTFIDYPVFNFADCCVVVGAILMCIYVLKMDSKKG
jgi:signal peptidase II